jgi:hypothetical protein
MKCPACGEVMEMRVEVTLKLPANYVNLISKEVIKKKECQLVAANWEKARATCYGCGYREVGL